MYRKEAELRRFRCFLTHLDECVNKKGQGYNECGYFSICSADCIKQKIGPRRKSTRNNVKILLKEIQNRPGWPVVHAVKPCTAELTFLQEIATSERFTDFNDPQITKALRMVVIIKCFSVL